MPNERELPMEISCQAVKSRLDAGEKFLFVDCREPDEHALVHIEGTRLLPLSELPARGAELEAFRERNIVVHCHHGGRSMRMTQWLRQQGFAGAQSMAGGIHAWACEIDPALPRY